MGGQDLTVEASKSGGAAILWLVRRLLSRSHQDERGQSYYIAQSYPAFGLLNSLLMACENKDFVAACLYKVKVRNHLGKICANFSVN